jgi:hypothetical protein
MTIYHRAAWPTAAAPVTRAVGSGPEPALTARVGSFPDVVCAAAGRRWRSH